MVRMGQTSNSEGHMPKENKIVRRCAWCSVKHLIDDKGNSIPGNAHEAGVLYSDGICKAQEIILNAQIDKMERRTK